MRQSLAWLTVCALPLLSAISTASQNPPPGISARELVWQEFTAPDKSFKLMFPAKPVKQKVPPDVKSSGIDIGAYKSTLANLEFLLMYMNLPYATEDAQTSKRLLDGGRDLALANTKAQLLSETDMWLDDHPGRELLVKFPKTIMRARIFLLEHSMYTLSVLLPYNESNQKVIQDAVELMANRYFASFKKLSPKK